MAKRLVKLTESRLYEIIYECVNRVLHDGRYVSVVNEYLDRNYGVPLYKKAQEEFDDVRIVKNEWLVHSYSGDIGGKIITNGFSNGLSRDELNRYSMIWASGKHEDHGYSWAFRAEKFLNSGGDTVYGNSILFQASGVEYYNPVDGNNQVMFYNKSARNKILIYEWDGEANKLDKFTNYRKKTLYGVGNINGKPLYVGAFGDVVNWCITNFRQYRKYLLSNSEIPHVSDKTEDEYENYLESTGYSNLPDGSANLYDKWHNYYEEKEDWEHYNKLISDGYKKFVEDHKAEIKKIEDRVDSHLGQSLSHYEAPQREKLRKQFIDIMLSAEGLSYSDFITDFQKKHFFFDRKRADGHYWRK